MAACATSTKETPCTVDDDSNENQIEHGLAYLQSCIASWIDDVHFSHIVHDTIVHIYAAYPLASGHIETITKPYHKQTAENMSYHRETTPSIHCDLLDQRNMKN